MSAQYAQSVLVKYMFVGYSLLQKPHKYIRNVMICWYHHVTTLHKTGSTLNPYFAVSLDWPLTNDNTKYVAF